MSLGDRDAEKAPVSTLGMVTAVAVTLVSALTGIHCCCPCSLSLALCPGVGLTVELLLAQSLLFSPISLLNADHVLHRVNYFSVYFWVVFLEDLISDWSKT